MADKRANTGLLWAILVLAIADVAFIISFKMDFIPVFAEKISETTAEMISELFLLFFLIVLILYVPGGRAKRIEKVPTVEVTPITETEEILFTSVSEESEEIVEVEEYHSVQEEKNGADDEAVVVKVVE